MTANIYRVLVCVRPFSNVVCINICVCIYIYIHIWYIHMNIYMIHVYMHVHIYSLNSQKNPLRKAQ